MGDEPENRTFKEKLLFYTTAFFILLGTFSLFAFLFLVPFVIEPAFTTIFMKFEEVPALCETYDVEINYGAKNCSWSSCREGCTKDIYICTQVRVNYRLNLYNFTDEFNFTEYHINLKEAERVIPPVKRTDRYERAIRDYEYDGIGEHPIAMASYNLAALNDNNNNININNNDDDNDITDNDNDDAVASDIINIDLDSESLANMQQDIRRNTHLAHVAFGDPDGTNGFFVEQKPEISVNDISDSDANPFDEISKLNEGLMGEDSMYYFVGARLFPNVKGCGYPPMLNCTIWLKRYTKIGIKFPCYYSKVDPSLVISDLDYWKNTLNLVYSMAIPIPSFIISVIYLTYAYFKIYNEDEETAPLDKNAEDMDIDEEAIMDDSDGAALADNAAGSQIVNMDHTTAASIGSTDIILANGGPGMQKSISQGGGSLSASRSQHMIQSPGVAPLTPNSEMNSFGHQLNVQMADDMSRDSLENGVLSTSNSVQGNLSKTMTTSISTAPGPLANV